MISSCISCWRLPSWQSRVLPMTDLSGALFTCLSSAPRLTEVCFLFPSTRNSGLPFLPPPSPEQEDFCTAINPFPGVIWTPELVGLSEQLELSNWIIGAGNHLKLVPVLHQHLLSSTLCCPNNGAGFIPSPSRQSGEGRNLLQLFEKPSISPCVLCWIKACPNSSPWPYFFAHHVVYVSCCFTTC